jgi:riboflavin kinase/FMN adenylyltransferase
MRVIDFHRLGSERTTASGITIGAFDGVHLGHRRIFQTLTSLSAENKLKPAAITFQPLPREVFGETQKKIAILSFEERKRRIAGCGIELLVVINFTREFARQTGDEFMAKVRAGLRPGLMVVGHDFSFGKGKKNDLAWLRAYCEKFGIVLKVVDAVKKEGEVVSSSRIRALLNAGRMELAADLLGEPYQLEGRVVRGHHRGKDLGFATANLAWKKELLVPTGIYIAWACFDEQRWPAVVNIGFNPTFGDQELSIEAHLLGFKKELYGRSLRLALLKKIRDEKKFEKVEELQSQIRQDIETAKSFLGVK